MAALQDQLRQLHTDLKSLIEHDPEQELQGPALPLADKVLREAKEALLPESTVREQVEDLISPAQVERGESLRAADVLVAVGQLLASVRHYRGDVQIDAELLARVNEALRRPSPWKQPGA